MTGIFNQYAVETNNYLDNPSYLTELATQPHLELTNINTILQALVSDKPTSFSDCVAWARLLFQTEFDNKIVQLLHVFPADSCK